MRETRSQADVKTHLTAKYCGRVLSKFHLSGSRLHYEHTSDISYIIEDEELLDQIKNCMLLKS